MTYIHNINPIMFELFSIKLYWYGFMYALSFIIIDYLIVTASKNKKIILSKDQAEKFTIVMLIFAILGGRIGYIIFYNFSYYLDNIFDIFKIWQGGMSFHGGLLGVIASSYIFAKKNNQNPFFYLDQVSLVAPVGIFFGRLANFINSELYGTVSSAPWSVIFIKIDNLSRHPSQLYEAILEGIILFLILIYFINKDYLKKPGLISGLFLIFYSLFRFLIEFFRVPDEQIGYLILNLTMGQIISLVFALIGTTIFYFKYENK